MSRRIEGLLVGEVWMASGQSNMQWVASKSSVVNLVNQLKEKGETPPIREFRVTSTTSALHPIERATGEWKVDEFGGYSAVAFAFALKLYEELGVPIGVLNCSFSETSIESWVPREGFAAGTDDVTRAVYQKILETDPSTPGHKAAWEAYYQSLEDAIKTNAELVAAGMPARQIPTSLPGNLRGNRDASWMFNGRMAPVVPFAIRGAIWNQGYANMHAGLQYYHNLHSLIRGWRMVWGRPELPVYFNQFYCPGNFIDSEKAHPAIGGVAEMRLGTWLARDIPHTGMASQIDIDGAVHYQQKALLPASPFIYYDHELVTAETWPDSPIKIAGVEVDASTVGLPWEYRRLALLSTQFRDNAVFQADMPVTLFGAVTPYPGYEQKGECVIHFKFGDIEETIPVTAGMEEWSVTLPPRPASTNPQTLRVGFHIDGEVVHERVCENIIFGDVWYVASPPVPRGTAFEIKNSGQTVRAIKRVAKRTAADRPSRFSVATSTSPDNNRFASFWHDAEDDLAAAIGHRIAAQTGRPSGVILMDSGAVPIASWMSFEHLKHAPSLRADYEDLAQIRPGNEFYDANVRRYISTWRNYWSDYVPTMIATRAAPDGANWGQIPAFAAEVSSKATHTHNVLTASFVPGSYTGIIFLGGPAMVEHDDGANFGSGLAALAGCWIRDFGGKARFIHTIPDKSLAPKIVDPSPAIPGSTAIRIGAWDDFPAILDGIESTAKN